jgi:hypothetical protein
MVSWHPIPTLRCAPNCEADLQRLATRAGVDQAIGLELIEEAEVARAIYVNANDGRTEARVIAALAKPPELFVSAPLPPPKPFSPWLLVPFGVGQISQKRYVTGGIYAGLQVGLLAWHVATVVRHNGDEDTQPERDLRAQRNLSAALLIGAMVASVVEAVVIDAASSD